MPYYLDFAALDLEYLATRLREEDLIQSQLPLRGGLAEKLAAFRKAGIGTLADVQGALKNDASLARLSSETGVPADYLKLLARALRGYLPKSARLSEYPGVPEGVTGPLARNGITDSRALWTAASRAKPRAALAAETGIAPAELLTLVCLCDLSRIQWVSPLFARLIHDSGTRTVKDVAKARARDLAEGVAAVNGEQKLFKGKIGEKDMGRLVYLASQLSHELEA